MHAIRAAVAVISNGNSQQLTITETTSTSNHPNAAIVATITRTAASHAQLEAANVRNATNLVTLPASAEVPGQEESTL
jgi:hypothetical protein